MPRLARLWPRLLGGLLLVIIPCLTRVNAAQITVDVSGVEGATRTNVLLFLSVERYKDRTRMQPEVVQRLYNRIPDEVRSALRPMGYYDPKVTSSIAGPDADGHWRIAVDIAPGAPVLFGTIDVKIEGPGQDDPAFRRMLATPGRPHQGEQLNHGVYDQLKSDLIRTATNYGYLDWEMTQSELLVDSKAHVAQVHLHLTTGERYKFGKVTFVQKAINAAAANRLVRFREGDPFDATKLLQTQFALDDSQYYSGVEVVPGERDKEKLVVPVTITAGNSIRTFSFGPGYGSDTLERLTAIWNVPRVNEYGHRFRVQLELSVLQKIFDAHYEIPFGDRAVDKFSIEGIGQQVQFGDQVSTNELAAIPGITRISGRWQQTAGINFAHTVTTDSYAGGNPSVTNAARRVDNLVLPTLTFASVPEGYLGESFFNRGLWLQLMGSSKQLGARTNFLRLDTGADRVFTFTEQRNWHLLLRGELGLSTVSDVTLLPGQFRFYAGGERSVRGFAFDDLSTPSTWQCMASKAPQALTCNAQQLGSAAVLSGFLGGPKLLTGTTEVERDLPRNFGVAVFVDAGNAVRSFGDHLKPFAQQMALSTGIGVRLRLPVVTVGLDISQALHAPGYAQLPGPRLDLNISPKL